MDQEQLRKEVRILKAIQGIQYSEVAEMLNLSRSSFYNLINGGYEFGKERTRELEELIYNLKGE